MKKLILGILAISLLLATGRAQDKNILFSQYRFNGLTVNPAYAGSHEVFSASLLGRYQWVGFEGAPKDYALNFHFPGKNTKTGWGGNVIYETVGIRSTIGVYANYAYRMLLGTGTLSMGLRGGFASGNQEILNLSGDDPVFSENSDDYFLPNFGIGIYYNNRKGFAGLSVPFILGYESNNNGNIVAYHDFSMYTYYLTGGIHLNLNDQWKLTPSMLMQYESASGILLDGTVNILYREVFGAGLSYRTSGALIMLLNYKLNYQTTLGMAYDFGFGGMNQYNRSSFEIALQIDLGFKIDRSNPMVF
jgi:type IX secretion system PorP/SprF family membrane protein